MTPCPCAAAGHTRPECRAGIFGRPVHDADGTPRRVFPPLPCWLDAGNLLCPDWAAPRAADELRLRATKSNYSQGRSCATCGRAICNQNRSGLCQSCVNRRSRAAQLARARA
jgi:hypothetical protein